MSVKVSVIVPVYNAKEYLRECLDSLINQTLSDIEIICVNDGSTDGSDIILKEYEENIPFLSVINQRNSGLSVARNNGMAKAKGKYIGFVDSDDFVKTTMYETLYTLAEKDKAEITVANHYLFDNKTGMTQVYRDMLDYYRFSLSSPFTLKENPKIIRYFAAWDRIFLREFLVKNKIEFIPDRIFEDNPFTCTTLYYAKRISVSNERCYFYRKNTGNSITDNEVKRNDYKFDFLKNLRETVSFFREKDICDKIWEQFWIVQLENVIWHHCNIKQKTVFRRFYKQLKEILSEKDIKTIKNLRLKKLTVYSDLLNKSSNKLFNAIEKIIEIPVDVKESTNL